MQARTGLVLSFPLRHGRFTAASATRITGQHSGMVKNRGIGWGNRRRLPLSDEKKESAIAFLDQRSPGTPVSASASSAS